MNPIRPDDDGTEDLLRRALGDEAADVQPDPDALSAIQQRTATQPFDSANRARRFAAGSSRRNPGGRPPWMLGAVGAAAATVAVIAAVVVVSNNTGTPSGTPAAGPSTTVGNPEATQPNQPAPSDMTVSASPAVPLSPVTMYYLAPHGLSHLKHAPRLFPEIHMLPSSKVSAKGANRDVAAVHDFLTSQPFDKDYSSGWPSGVDVQGIARRGGTTTIALTGTANLGDCPCPGPYDPYRQPAVQALLATADVQGQAQFTYNGEPLRWLFYDPATVVRTPNDEVRAWVSITNPHDRTDLLNPVTVTGSANVFEGNLNWQLLDANGQVVDSGNAVAGSMEWKPFTIELGTLQPGTYTIRAYESSPKNGRPTYVDDKTFTVHP